jgi:SnoaL-like polyketide cyclase
VTDQDTIRAYYGYFNARRLDDARALLAANAHLEHPDLALVGDSSGSYAVFADRWLSAFPDSVVTIEGIDPVRGDGYYEVHLIGEGTQQADFDMGPLGIIKATHRRGRLRFRHLLQVRDGRIISSTLSFDTQSIIQQLANASA